MQGGCSRKPLVALDDGDFKVQPWEAVCLGLLSLLPFWNLWCLWLHYECTRSSQQGKAWHEYSIAAKVLLSEVLFV